MSTQRISARPVARRIAALVAAALGLLSAFVGGRNALSPGRSQDFQWSGVSMLVDRIDPWLDFLKGDPLHRIQLTQVPNYLPVLYLFLSPVGLLPLSSAKVVWLVCNLIFAVASAVLAARFYGLRDRMVLVVGLFLMATCVRNSLGNGQQGLLILLLWCLTLLHPVMTGRRATAAGISYFKFNFAPPLALYLLMRDGVRALLCSFILPAVACVLVWFWLPGAHHAAGLLRFAVEPFQAARVGYLPRGTDINLMDAVEPVFRAAGASLQTMDLGETLLATAACIVVFYFGIVQNRTSSAQYHVALLATVSVAFFRHHNYDQVTLLLPLCFALAHWRRFEAKVILAVLAWLFYVQRIAEQLHMHPVYFNIPEFLALAVALYMVYRLRETSMAATSQVAGR